MRSHIIRFYEGGLLFTWSPVTRRVERGDWRQEGCRNIGKARTIARDYIKKIKSISEPRSTKCPTCEGCLLSGDHRDCAI
jgi:hypothetical protein